MSRESVRAFFEANAPDIEPVVLTDSTATVVEAARAGRADCQDAGAESGDERILVVMAGTGRLDNRKTKDAFGNRPRMLPADEVLGLTSHPVGGVCPFGLPQPVRVFCDTSLRAFDEVWPAAGDRNSSVCLTPDRLAKLVGAEWVDVSQH